MSPSALVGGRVLCMHGGLSPDLINLDAIRAIKKPQYDLPPSGLLVDLLWSDPDGEVNGFARNERGVSYRFGSNVVIDSCERLGIDLVARAHQVVMDGYEFFAQRHLVTIFTAPDYGDKDNHGAVLVVDKNLSLSPKVIPSSKRPMLTFTGPGTGQGTKGIGSTD